MSTIVEIEKLLTEVNGIIEKHKKVDEMTGKNFNIFKVCEIDEKEVLICRFIYQLINPKGLHNQGDVFLRKFITDVLGGVISDSEDKDGGKLIITESELSNVRVYKEFVIKNNRRIDLLIDTNEHTIPIEVKIFAGDQENQCNDYLEYTKKSTLYYLTLFGDPPSDYSYDCNNIKKKNDSFEDECDQKIEDIKDEISCISFRDHIVPWVEDCIKDINIIDKKQIVDNLMQFLNAVRGLCNMGDNELNNDLKNILEDKDNFATFLELKKPAYEVQSQVLIRIIKDLKNLADKEYEIDEIYSDYEIQAGKLCKGGNIGDKVPGFGIVYGSIKFKCKLCICVEANKRDKLYYGVYIKERKEDKQLLTNEIKNYLNERGMSGDGYNVIGWPFWDHIKINGEMIDFVEPNVEFIELLDKYKSKGSDWGCFIKDIWDKVKHLIEIIEE